MNKTLEKYAREQLLYGLRKCNSGQVMIFKRMYSHNDLGMSFEEVVKIMDVEKLDWALTQVERTLDKADV